LTTTTSSKKTKISLLLAAVTLSVGFADLIRGGTTLSALLLAIGYCVLIPMAIWQSGAPVQTGLGEDSPPPYGAALIASVMVFGLYRVTMAPSTAMWDTSEYIAAAYTFGLPHPPGNPFFVIVGHVFSFLPVASTVAARINVLAAVCSAIAAGAWFLIAERVVRTWLPARWQRLTCGALAAIIGSTAFTVWNQSVVNEKVYTVSLAGIALISWLAVEWCARPERSDANRLLMMIAYLCGLGYANHMAGMLPLPAVAFAVIVRRPSTILRWRLLLTCAVALMIGLTPFATQPIRAAQFPALNEGEPTACRTRLELSCTLSAATYHVFMYNFNRGQYGKPSLSDRQASFGDQVGMWWLYFRWQWLRDADAAHLFAQALLASCFLVLGLLGAWIHYQRDRRTFWYFGPLMVTTSLVLIYYLNFKLGSSQDPASAAPREVRDRDYFFLWSYSAWGVWAAVGLMHAWQLAATLFGTEKRRTARDAVTQPTKRSWVLTSPMLLVAVVPLAGNWTSASHAAHHATRDMAADLLNSVEPYGVLVTVGDNDTFPLWYAQEVEGVRRDVVVANTSLLNTDWYARQIIRRPIYAYDAAAGPAVYRDRRWPKPTTPPLHLTFSDVDAIPDYYDLRQPTPFDLRGLHVTVDPRRLEFGVLMRADALVLRMIQDSWPERPVYFARSAGGYPRALGLENNLLTQGLAAKLFIPPSPSAAARDTLFIQGDGWFDVARTNTLWNDVYKGQRDVVAEGRWIDRPSASMPALYVFAGAELADALRATGNAAAGNVVQATAIRVAQVAGLEGLVQGLRATDPTPVAGDSSGITLRVNTADQPQTRSTEPTVRKPRR
jgi:hypothetical protein